MPIADALSAYSIKVRQQLRTQSKHRPNFIQARRLAESVIVAPGARGNSFWSVGVEMARTEGIRSLAGGMSASMLREVVYSGIRMGTYELFKDKCAPSPHLARSGGETKR